MLSLSSWKIEQQLALARGGQAAWDEEGKQSKAVSGVLSGRGGGPDAATVCPPTHPPTHPPPSPPHPSHRLQAGPLT